MQMGKPISMVLHMAKMEMKMPSKDLGSLISLAMPRAIKYPPSWVTKGASSSVPFSVINSMVTFSMAFSKSMAGMVYFMMKDVRK